MKLKNDGTADGRPVYPPNFCPPMHVGGGDEKNRQPERRTNEVTIKTLPAQADQLTGSAGSLWRLNSNRKNT
jgi:hypothetical protein